MAIASCIQRQYKQQSKLIQINNYLHADFPVTPASDQSTQKYHVFSKHSFGICYISSSSGVGVAACGNNQAADTTPDFPEAQAEGFKNTAAGSNLSGNVKLDGSSTVFPVSKVMASEFQDKS